MEDDSDEAKVARYWMNRLNGGPIDPNLEALDRALWISKYAPKAAAPTEQIRAEEEIIKFSAVEQEEEITDLTEIVEYTPKVKSNRDQAIGKLDRLERVLKKIRRLGPNPSE